MELVVYPIVFYLAKSWQRATFLPATPGSAPPEIHETQPETDTPKEDDT